MGIFDSFKKKKPEEKPSEMKPETTNENFALVNVYKAQGKLNDALREYQEALKINPNFAIARKNLAIVLEKLGQR